MACYQILEQRLAGILVSNIQKVKTVEEATVDPNDADAIPIPIYDVYNALIENSVIDIEHFTESDATALGSRCIKFLEKQQVFNWISRGTDRGSAVRL